MNTKEKFLIELVDSLPQLKLRLPRVTECELGTTKEIDFRGRTVIFKLEEGLNGYKIWTFKQLKR